jgi:MoaA/NifB/PqqE/SkfB family radical SAM enzyme
VGSGFLRLSDFQKVLDENPWIAEIELSNYGEIFLNPDLLGIIKYAYKRNVGLTANTGVNLNYVKEDVLEGLVKYKFRNIKCSIDGASDATYKRYRIRGNYEIVIENIKKINLFKKQYRSQYPLLSWQFVIFGHNEHELLIAQKLAKELRMYFYPKLSWDADFSPVRNQEFVRTKVSAASREEYKKKHGVDLMHQICYQLWDSPQINWDGKVLGCCRNFWGDFGGNVFTDGLFESLNNNKINYARDMLLGRLEARDDIPCATCDIFLHMKTEGKWLKRKMRGPLLSLLRLTPPTVKQVIKRLFYYH